MLSPVLSAQVWLPPAVTVLNPPSGGVLWPWVLSPQQAMALSPVLSAQVWLLPVVTVVNPPSSGVLWPEVLFLQHSTVPSSPKPQA